MAARRSILAGTALLLGACADPQAIDAGDEDASETRAETDTDETGSDGPPDLPDSETDSGTDTDTEAECPPPPCEACTCVAGELECACEEFVAEAGFVELAATDYALGLGAEASPQSSTASRQFWAFQPADVAPEDAPVFVFFNGGPGVSSGMLLGLNTGRSSFDPQRTGPDETVVANPHSWTRLGNLVWIDARQTGFSYGLLEDPSDQAARAAAMSLANFNSYRDAGDFVHTLLRFLAEHPSLRDNPIVLVSESYGGTRAQLMLDMVLHAQAYADGSRRLTDPALVAAIEEHVDAVIGVDAGPEQIAGQFGRQILIQPAMTGDTLQFSAGALFEQPGSVIETLALELGVDYMTCAEQGGFCNPFTNALDFVAAQGRSPYDYQSPNSWLNDVFALVNDRLNDSSTTEALLGITAASIPGFAADERSSAWRSVGLDTYPADAALGDWPELTGALEPWDRYFVGFNTGAFAEFRSFQARQLEIDPADPHFGAMFLSNSIWVDALCTEAAYDLVVYTPAIPIALAGYESVVSSVTVDPDGQEWLIEYVPELGVGSRIVTVPRYESSHAVTLDEPGQLLDDVELWIAG